MAVAKYGKGTVFALGDPWLYNAYTDGRKMNNAGTIRRARAVDFSEEDWTIILDVNLTSHSRTYSGGTLGRIGGFSAQRFFSIRGERLSAQSYLEG